MTHIARPGAAHLEKEDGTPVPNPWNIQHLRKFYPRRHGKNDVRTSLREGLLGLLTLHRKAEGSPAHTSGCPALARPTMNLEGATRPRHPQAMHLNSREYQPHDDGSPVSAR